MRISKKRDKGFSLIELLIALSVFAIITGGLFTSLTRGQKRFRYEQDVLEAQQMARNAMDMMEREIRLAGLPDRAYYDSASAGVANNEFAVGITTANSSNLIFEGDINEDGIVETVQYTLSGTTLQRSAVAKGDAASLQTLAQNVSGLTFSYFNSDGNALAAPVATPANIGRVQIALALTANQIDPDSRDIRSVSMQGAAQVRNP
jgi:prepilin-type N-terminal cleavage/methylation domain-containing protein